MAANNYLNDWSVYRVAPKREVLAAKANFPGQTEPKPKGHIHAISLRGDNELHEPTKKVTEQKKSSEQVIGLSEEEGEMVFEDEVKKTHKLEPTVIPIEPYKPPTQRLAQAKLEKKYGKFLDFLKTLHINIPFSDVISEMPSYDEFLKDMLFNEIKIEENKLNMDELKPTHISLQPGDRTIKFPLVSLEDVPLLVGKFFIPCNFAVMEMEEDAHVPVIL
ncbi:uncharacterized protein LOC104897340 [Beta vulgaris subsp. vulgaris]|uniref:uncharacterized protein LOC104897340 n=1 Tax=Beta vulgaris subsp. vulgaris TaxID=3555 RepID=UPI0020372D62|nr:uncharacterized protein LOC104897340 [Beta vulgaris subsp. vulgaris]